MCTLFKLSNFDSKLSYLGGNLFSVDPNSTAKLGWVRGETYFDTYAPALPKTVRDISIKFALPSLISD